MRPPRIFLLLGLGIRASNPTACAQDVTISAAVSMKEAVEELGARFQRARPGAVLRYNFGGSGELQQQIEAGSPVDVFVSATDRQMDELDRKGWILSGSRRTFARNALAVVVPAGQYAEESLRRLGLRVGVRDRLVFGENVRQVLEYVVRGEVDAGFVYAANVRLRTALVKEAFRPPHDSYPPVPYPATVGLPLAYRMARRKFRARWLLDLAVTLPLVLPPTVTGYYLIVLLGRRGWIGAPLYDLMGWSVTCTWYAAVIAAAVMALPLLVRTARREFEGPRSGRGAHACLVRRDLPGGTPGDQDDVNDRLDVQLRLRLNGFTLDVAWTAGDGVSVLFGPSGSGKTPTLHCLAGLVRPEAGRIVVDGRVLFDGEATIHVPPQERRLGYVFQGCALFPHLTVRSNTALGLHRRSPAERARRTAAAMEKLGLAGLGDRHLRELSGGQRQRVALGRALAMEPALLLLDEPLSALDVPARRTLRDELQAVLADWNIPTGLRVAWRGQHLEVRVPPDLPALPAPGSPVTFFVRPEDLRLIRKDGPPPDRSHHTNILSGHVVRETDRGVTWTLMVRLDAPGDPAQEGFDLEIDVPRFVYEMLRIDRERSWQFSIHRGSLHLLPD
jgi:molybdate transport system ATP-binding protein